MCVCVCLFDANNDFNRLFMLWLGPNRHRYINKSSENIKTESKRFILGPDTHYKSIKADRTLTICYSYYLNTVKDRSIQQAALSLSVSLCV